jgi:hypothetical protein
MTKHGLWIDDAPRLLDRDDYWRSFRDLGFTTAAVMLETVTTGFDPKFTLVELSRLGERLRAADVELVLTVWPEPRVLYLQQLVERLPALLHASRAVGLEFDTESNYTPRRLQGFKSMDEASDALMKVVTKFREIRVRSELTTFTMHGENSRHATLADDVDVLLPQAYSVRNREDAKGKPFLVPWDHQYGPGGMQRLTLDRARQVPTKDGRPMVACGLAAYDQSWPGRKPEDAMRVAYDAALKYGPEEVRWWSSKWVIGARAQPYAARFFASVKP